VKRDLQTYYYSPRGGEGGVDSSTRTPKGRWKNEVISKEKTRYEETKGEWKDGFIEKDTGT
jgi:hypothetical protein